MNLVGVVDHQKVRKKLVQALDLEENGLNF